MTQIPSNFPPHPGAYALNLYLEEQKQICVGRLGKKLFPSGEYVYLGSALGPGGLKARLNRHLSNHVKKRPHWHIDYLRKFCKIRSVNYLLWEVKENQIMPIECTWSQMLIQSLQGRIPAKHFGSSDCRCGCPAHLVSFPKLEDNRVDFFIDTLRHNLSDTLNINISTLICVRF